jgi:hypothetical protein
MSAPLLLLGSHLMPQVINMQHHGGKKTDDWEYKFIALVIVQQEYIHVEIFWAMTL